jgi:DNA replication protein DnaC
MCGLCTDVLVGLESVKQQFLSIKAKVDTVVRQGVSLKGERFGAALLGNPGTGKTLNPSQCIIRNIIR